MLVSQHNESVYVMCYGDSDNCIFHNGKLYLLLSFMHLDYFSIHLPKAAISLFSVFMCLMLLPVICLFI